ncbi:MAG: sigma-54-dependent transcriptional regulator [Puniceicoccaceae bacterium]
MSLDKPPSVLIADDQQEILQALRVLLRGEGCKVKTVNTPDEALDALAHHPFDVALIDLNYARDTTSGQEGLDLIHGIRKLDPCLPIVVMTAWATIDLAVECMRSGAADFMQKPWENARVTATVYNQTEFYRAKCRATVLEDENRALKESKSKDFLAKSDIMRPVLEVMHKVAPSDANILITGENGTGKGVAARYIHSRSSRSTEPFVSINMGGLASGVAESELFGHVKGAFTDAKSDRAGRFEMADGGTLFMDEIGNLPMEQQQKLLRVLETGEFERVGSSRTLKVNVRIISATNSDLQKSVREGKFREDLLYRLNTIPVHLPPLRERKGDVELLANHFLQRHIKRYNKQIDGLMDKAVEALLQYNWPGNVRELDHTIERSVLLSSGNEIRVSDLGLIPTAAPSDEGATGGPSLDDMSLEDVEKYLIQRTLKRNDGNATKTAQDLGLSRSAFYRRLQRFGL